MNLGMICLGIFLAPWFDPKFRFCGLCGVSHAFHLSPFYFTGSSVWAVLNCPLSVCVSVCVSLMYPP